MKTLLIGLLLLLSISTPASGLSADESTYTPRQLENAEQALFDALALPWYELEFIVIERLSVLAFNSREQLIVRAQRTLPANAALLIEPGQTESLTRPGALQNPSWYEDSDHCFDNVAMVKQTEFSDKHLNPLEPGVLEQQGLSEADQPDLREEDSVATAADDVTDATPVDAMPSDASIEERTAAATQVQQRALSPEEQAVTRFKSALLAFEQALVHRSLQPAAELNLTTQVKLINRRRTLRPLLHLGWLQPAPPRIEPQPIMLSYQEQNLPEKLAGHVALTRGRYLHLDIDLWYTVPGLGWQPQPVVNTSLAPELVAGSQQFMRLNQSRRMRSGELHYLDHPKLGVIVQVLPVKIPTELVVQYLDLGTPRL